VAITMMAAAKYARAEPVDDFADACGAALDIAVVQPNENDFWLKSASTLPEQ
jgi:hypothetical protein